MTGFQSRPDADYNASNVQEQAASGLAVAGTRKATRRKSKYQIADTSSVAAADDIRNQPLNTSSRTSRNAARGSRDDLPHISTRPSLIDPTRIDTSIWSWDTQADTVGSSVYYEPQGELLQERREQDLEAAEVTLPYPVSHRRPSLRSYSSQGSARPARPVGAGNKRRVSWETEQPRRKLSLEQQLSLPELSAMNTDDAPPSLTNTPLASGSDHRPRPRDDVNLSSGQPNPLDFQEQRTQPSGSVSIPRTFADSSIPSTLPARKVFPIQIGDRLFRLSGASISSDTPSYFSHFFEDQLRQNQDADSVRTLYVDRDPATFEDISLHLQGYHIEPRDGPHFVRLFADAQFFNLPRLTAQLFASTIYIRIGDEEFQISRDLFNSPGDSPNYFSLGFSVFFTTPNECFPGLGQRTLLRPPSILPPSVPNRSARTFADLLHMLKGYPLEIRNEQHRTELLKDARYFHLKGLEQKLIPHEISYNLARGKSEIVIRLEDIRQSGISFAPDAAEQASSASSSTSTTPVNPPIGSGWIFYQRPYADSEAHSLIVEMQGDESTFLSIDPGSANSLARTGRATFHKQTLSRMTSLLSIIASKLSLPITQPLGLMALESPIVTSPRSFPPVLGSTGTADDRVKVRIGADADVTLDGVKWLVGEEENEESDKSDMEIDPSETSRSTKKRKRDDGGEDEGEEWVIKKAQWRLRVQTSNTAAQPGRSGMEVILGAVKIEAMSSETSRNAGRGFLA